MATISKSIRRQLYRGTGCFILLPMHRNTLHKQHKLKNTHQSLLYKRKPAAFRVILKNRNNGMAEASDTQSLCSASNVRSQSIKHTSYQTQSSFSNNKDLKDFAKSLNPNRSSEPNLETMKGLTHKLTNHQNRDDTPISHLKRDIVRSRSQSRSLLQPSDIALPMRFDLMKLEEIEKRIDILIQMKLIRAKNEMRKGRISSNAKVGPTFNESDQIETELRELVSQIMRRDNEEAEVTLDSVNKKINILEKIMAESATESEMIKKYFQSKLNNRKPIHRKQYDSEHAMNLSHMPFSERSSRPNASISFETINSTNFRAPRKEDYPLRSPKPEYKFNNQPMPRSSYGCDFLTYGQLPKFTYKESPSDIMPRGTNHLQTSSYRAEYTTKKPNRVNFKELDCFQDKFKNLKVSFMENRNVKTEQSEQERPSSRLVKYSSTKSRKTPVQEHKSHYIKDMKTENQVNYLGEKPTIKSLIKHKNLSDLKYAFKAALHT